MKFERRKVVCFDSFEFEELFYEVPTILHAYQLHPGHVLFPPKVFLVFWSQCRQEIIKVHHHVYQGVQKANKHALFAWKTPVNTINANFKKSILLMTVNSLNNYLDGREHMTYLADI